MIQKLQYPSLNGLRAVSIIIVVVHHLNKFYFKSTLLDQLPIIADGQFAVNVFFIISGFLITGILENEQQNEGTISLKNFYLKRCCRIFPAYIFLLLVYASLQNLGIISIGNASWLTAITYTKYVNWWQDWYTLHAWSLSIEEQFYLIWPLLFFLPKKARVFFLWVIIIFVPIIKLYLNAKVQNSWRYDLHIVTRFDAIAWGCLLAIYQQKIQHYLEGKYRLYSIILLFVLLVLPYLPAISAANHLHLGYLLIPLGSSFGTIANICIAGLVFIFINQKNSSMFWLLNSRFLNSIGIYSYSIYLWQQFFIAEPIIFVQQFPLNIICVMVVSICSYHFIEKPFLTLKKNYFQ